MPLFLLAIDINSPIVRSPHNLASGVPSVRTNVRVKEVSETEICKFCHLAHSASVEPSWGHRFSSATFRQYSSATLKSPRNQPDGGSKQCLSCHDGTVAVGGTLKGNIAVTGFHVDMQGRLITTSVLNLGTDLKTPGANTHLKHPISIAVTDSLIAATQVNTWRLRPLRTVNGKYEIDQYGPSGNEVYYPLRPTTYAHMFTLWPDTGWVLLSLSRTTTTYYKIGNFMKTVKPLILFTLLSLLNNVFALTGDEKK